MSSKNRPWKAVFIVLLALIIAFSFTLPSFTQDSRKESTAEKKVTASGKAAGSRDSGEDSKNENPENKDAQPKAKEPAKKTGADYLFIGNSMMFFNNTLEMFRNMVKAGTGKEITTEGILYNGRTLAEHANAIQAIVRTKGSSANLTAEEREYFNEIDGPAFSQDVYDGYASRIWDRENGRPIRYKKIMLQIYYKNGAGDKSTTGIYKAIKQIIKAMNNPGTTYIIHTGMGKFVLGLNQFTQDQTKIDSMIKDAVSKVKKKMPGKFKKIQVALGGRAVCNYLCRFGSDFAQNTEPEAFAFYDTVNQTPVNDLLLKDQKHPTLLGSYILVSALYSLLYGDPAKTIPEYKGGSHEYVTLVDGEKVKGKSICGQTYNDGNGFVSDELLNTAAGIAWETQKESLRLKPQLSADEPIITEIENIYGGVLFGWTTSEGAERFRILRKTGDSDWVFVSDTTDRWFYDPTVKSGKTYCYTVRCMDKNGINFTSTFNQEGTSIKYIAAPHLKTASANKSGIKITWNAVKGASKYRVYRVLGSTWVSLKDSKKTSFTDTSVVTGEHYFYTVRCVSDDGEENESSYNPIGIPAAYLDLPVIKKVFTDKKAVRLEWKPSKGAALYRVLRKEKGSNKWVSLAETKNLFYTDKTTKKNKQYQYTVRCVSGKHGYYTSIGQEPITIKR